MTEDDTDTSSPGWPLLARIVRARRKRLGWTQQDVTVRGPSITTVQTLEGGDPVATRTLSKIDDALWWPAATARTIVFADDAMALSAWEDFLTYCVHEVEIDEAQLTIHDVLLARRNQQQRPRHESANDQFLRELSHLNVALAEADYRYSAVENCHPEVRTDENFDRIFEIIQEVRGTLRDWDKQFSPKEGGS